MIYSNSSLQASLAHHQLNLVQQEKSSAMAKIATAQKINDAASDAVSKVMDTLLAGETATLDMASDNTLAGVSLTDSASAALEGASELLMRAEELAVRSSNGTLSDDERRMIDREMASIKDSLTELSNNSDFNGQSLFGNSFSIQAGNNAGDAIDVSFDEFSAEALALEDVDLSSQDGARAALGSIDAALSQVISSQASAGESSRQLRARNESIQVTAINAEAARSRIGDADMLETLTDLSAIGVKEKASGLAIKAAQEMTQSTLDILA